MPQQSRRLNQVSEQIYKKFSQVVNQQIELPPGVLVTVTRVRTSRDLRYVKIGISVYPVDQTDVVFAKICRNLRRLKFLMHQEIVFKYAPDIKVYIDKAAQGTFDLEEVLNRLKSARF